jgi:nitrate/TMAO reductase-like tetraheme cytochrome c subunit
MCGVKGFFASVSFSLLLMAGGIGCGGDAGNRIVESAATDEAQSCVVCHTNQQILLELAVEMPAGHSDAGEG